MEAATQAVLTDLYTTTLVALAIGLVVFTILRTTNPLARWGSTGNVYTAPYRPIDLAVAIGLLLLLFAVVTATREPPALDAPPKEMGILDVWSGAILQIAVLFAIGAYLGVIRRLNLGELFGLRQLKPIRLFFISLLAIILSLIVVGFMHYFYVTVILSGRWDNMEKQQIVEAFMSSSSMPMKILVAVAACIIAPIVEEFVFRGFLYGVLKKYSDRVFAAVVTSLVFAAIHLNIPALLPLGVLALCLTLAYEITGCLLVPILMHCFFNTLMLVGMIVESS